MTTRLRRGQGGQGFTLVEVMIALAILGLALVLLVKSVGNNVASAQNAQMMGVTAELARGKMYDIEELLLKEGFQETTQELDGDFDEEGWPNVTWKVEVQPVKLPAPGQPGEGTGPGGMPVPGAPGGLGGQDGQTPTGGVGGYDQADIAGGNLISQNFQLFQQVLDASIRRVMLTVTYELRGQPRELVVVAYFTDAAGMDKVIPGFGLGDGGGGDPTDPKVPPDPRVPPGNPPPVKK